MTYKIFIDLKRKDQDLAKDLARRLGKVNGLEVLPLESIDDENDFNIKKDSGLLKADEVILLLTPNSIDSKRFVFDMGICASLGKPVTCIMQGVDAKELPPIIKETTRISYANLDSYISKLQKQVATKQRALERMKEALRSEKLTWSSIERLADAGKVTESEAINILKNDPDVVLEEGKSGNQMARLKNRKALDSNV